MFVEFVGPNLEESLDEWICNDEAKDSSEEWIMSKRRVKNKRLN